MKRYVFDEGEELVFGQPLPSASAGPAMATARGESPGSVAIRLILRKLHPRMALPAGEVRWNATIEQDVLRALFPAGGPVVGSSSMMLAAALAKRQAWVAGAMPGAVVPPPGVAPSAPTEY